ncbi:MAG TPA: hypothetical protein VMB21_22000 [Candidatus Limnocylindria bacterium]|jgi:hypothetical protein|nr:hypothetical protein [Candidatus Limnocylindria bacterium]
MAKQLHILTQPADEVARTIIDTQRAQSGHEVEVVDLTVAEPDYAALVEKVFAADSVATW